MNLFRQIPMLPNNIKKIGSKALPTLIKNVWNKLTSNHDIEWIIKNELSTSTVGIDLELLGTVTNQANGSGSWLLGYKPRLTIPYNHEIVIGTESHGAGAIGLICYGFELPSRKYAIIYIYAGAPKHNLVNRSGGNILLQVFPQKPQLTQLDLDTQFNKFDYKSMRLRNPALQAYTDSNNETYNVSASFDGDKKVKATVRIYTS